MTELADWTLETVLLNRAGDPAGSGGGGGDGDDRFLAAATRASGRGGESRRTDTAAGRRNQRIIHRRPPPRSYDRRRGDNTIGGGGGGGTGPTGYRETVGGHQRLLDAKEFNEYPNEPIDVQTGQLNARGVRHFRVDTERFDALRRHEAQLRDYDERRLARYLGGGNGDGEGDSSDTGDSAAAQPTAAATTTHPLNKRVDASLLNIPLELVPLLAVPTDLLATATTPPATRTGRTPLDELRQYEGRLRSLVASLADLGEAIVKAQRANGVNDRLREQIADSSPWEDENMPLRQQFVRIDLANIQHDIRELNENVRAASKRLQKRFNTEISLRDMVVTTMSNYLAGTLFRDYQNYTDRTHENVLPYRNISRSNQLFSKLKTILPLYTDLRRLLIKQQLLQTLNALREERAPELRRTNVVFNQIF